VDIKAANIAESKDYGILRLIVDKCDEALAALKAASFSAECTQVVAVEVPDRPGGLAQVLETIEKVGLNIEYMYGFSIRHSDCALMVFRFDDAENASKALSAAGVGIVTCGSCRRFLHFSSRLRTCVRGRFFTRPPQLLRTGPLTSRLG
jgi:hypothetical protein